jgi:hypothetical protein
VYADTEASDADAKFDDTEVEFDDAEAAGRLCERPHLLSTVRDDDVDD